MPTEEHITEPAEHKQALCPDSPPPAVGTLWISRSQGRALPKPILITRVTEKHVFYRILGHGHSSRLIRWNSAFEPLNVAELADFILG